MIKLTSKDKIKSVVWIAFFFAASLALKLNLSVTLLLFLLYAYLRSKNLSVKDYRLLNLLLLYVLGLVSSYYIINKGLSVLLIPFSVIPMLATLLFSNLTISLLLLLAICVSAASFSSSPFTIMLLFLTSGVLSSLMTHNARKRNTIIRTGLAIGIMQVATLIFLDNFWIGLPSRYIILFVNGVISSVLVLGVLPVFEYLFKTLTNISLLEVADFNHPLLQRMVLEAPGTYHHSLVVGNISEAACEAVGANTLLARVGAYYHDIGKLQKPDYFSENQSEKESKHDKLTPTMSKLIIMNHVKEGVELAKKYKLNPLLIEFIQQHHGDSLVYYFYRRALEGLEEDEEVKEEGFRYPGPKPNTKETAIVLLADSVEAATRALKETDPAAIEGLVHKIINNKFIDRQLDECDLTLKDLEKISACFIRILSGIYHSRVAYPEEEISENNHKNFQKQVPIYPSRIKKAILRLLSQEKTKKPAEINILFVSDRKIKQLNFQYAHKDAATDVLAFGDLECADIVVSADTARRNARLYNTSEQFEACLYCLHGVLHILGFNDRGVRQRSQMDKKAYAVLSNLKG